MNRTCEPELLDSLPHDHPEAARSRRDLRYINFFMRNRPWFTRTLPSLVRAGEPVLELGAGTGELGRALSRSGLSVDGLDLCPRPPDWPAGRDWHRGDLKAFDGYGAYPVVIGNLIFHQFSDAELAALGEKLRASARLIVACEPQRRELSQRLMGSLGPLLGASPVTLHDARVSIAAGFLGRELPALLGLGAGWRCSCSQTVMGAVRVVAVRLS